MNLFLCRLPFSSDIISGASDRLCILHDTPDKDFNGFIFSKFQIAPQIFGIPLDSVSLTPAQIEDYIRENDSHYALTSESPDISTDYDTHISYVEALIKRIKELEKASGKPSKIVAARKKVVELHRSSLDVFHSLCNSYPAAFVFLFSTPLSGTWIGASPELLLETDGEVIHTIALAGTAAAKSDSDQSKKEIASAKNTVEHQIVVDFIKDIIHDYGYFNTTERFSIVNAGPVDHLRTDIYTNQEDNPLATPQDYEDVSWFIDLIGDLSPTPALGGFPRIEAVAEIKAREGFEREYYGGIVGLADLRQSRIDAYVNLRSGRFDTSRHTAALFAGGGITRDSDPKAEWEETELKLATMLNS